MSNPPPSPLLQGRAANCWQRSERRRFAQGAQRHAELVVLHGLKGQMRYLIDGRIVTLGPGSILWAFAGQAHVLLNETPDFDMWVFLVSERLLTVADDSLPPISAEDAPVEAGPRIASAHESAELSMIASGITAGGGGPALEHGVRWWLARAWSIWNAAPESRTRTAHPAVTRAAEALRRDPACAIRELSQEVGLSPGRLGRLFREQTGRSIVDFRTEEKLDRVDRALQERPRTNLLTAALDAGFAGYPQFYRAHKHVRGVAPFAYYRGTNEEER